MKPALPEGWEELGVGRLLDFKNGLNKAKRYFGHGTPIVNFMDVLENPGLRRHHIGGHVEVSPEEARSYSARQGDVFFTRTSETIEEVGLSAVLLDSIPQAVFSGFVLRGRPRNDRLVDEFKEYCFRTAAVRKQIISKGTYTTRALTNGRALSSVLLLVPPKSEQRTISNSLGDVDALLLRLRGLLAKKRDVRQAVAQELLSGQTRLPGFHRPWEQSSVGAISRIRGGNGFPVRLQGNQHGTYPFFKVSDMNHRGNETFMKHSNNWIDESTRSRIKAYAFPARTIVLAKVGAAVFLERKRILVTASCIDNNMAGLMVDGSQASERFVHYFLEQTRLGDFVSATALPALNGAELGAVPVSYPRELDEQAAIVEVLSDMDSDLDMLYRRISKTADIRQAIEQELLTGRTQLLGKEQPHE